MFFHAKILTKKGKWQMGYLRYRIYKCTDATNKRQNFEQLVSFTEKRIFFYTVYIYSILNLMVSAVGALANQMALLRSPRL